MTQSGLVSLFLRYHKKITPALIVGQFYRGKRFGSDIGRCCRQLRKDGMLVSERVGQYTSFMPSAKMRLIVEQKRVSK